MKTLFTTFLLAILTAAPQVYAQATAGGTVNLGPNAGLIVALTPALTKAGGLFGSFSGTTNLTYYIRTSQAGGAGSIQMKVTGDFAPGNGPAVSAGHLTYSCTANNPGSSGAAIPCAGPVAASTTGQTPVTSFGQDARSSATGDSASVQWSLKDDPAFKAGSYSATVTFTISAN